MGLATVLLSLAAACHAHLAPKPSPTVANASYGPHARNLPDFWKARSARPAPVAFFIHRAGGRDPLQPDVPRELLQAGISVAAIQYRLVPKKPLPAAHHDARRTFPATPGNTVPPASSNLAPKRPETVAGMEDPARMAALRLR